MIAGHTLHEEDDLGRTLRQVHRVLKTGAPFIMAWTTRSPPWASVGRQARRYGDDHRTVGDLLIALDRANFRVEAFHELGVSDEQPDPDHPRRQGPQAGLLTRRSRLVER